MDKLDRLVTGQQVGGELCRILGLPDRISSISLHVEANSVVHVKAIVNVTNDQMTEIQEVIKRYDLVERED